MLPQRKLRILPHAEAVIREPQQSCRKIRASLDAVLAEPNTGYQLRSELAVNRALRVGRVVYRIRGEELQVAAVGPRATVSAELPERIRAERRP